MESSEHKEELYLPKEQMMMINERLLNSASIQRQDKATVMPLQLCIEQHTSTGGQDIKLL